jgi:nitroreductase
MQSNPILNTMRNRKSIRRYKPEIPTNEVIETIVRAGQQAPFASQLCSLLLQRGPEGNPFKAPLFFIVCIDSYRWELVMAERDWEMQADDALLLLLGIQDAALMAENMVIAAESLGSLIISVVRGGSGVCWACSARPTNPTKFSLPHTICQRAQSIWSIV